VKLKYCSIEWNDAGASIMFPDGAHVESWPHPEDHHYYVIAHRCGYGDDLMSYCREHELAHALVMQELCNTSSTVLFALAHRLTPPMGRILMEESMSQVLQRWARANERPILAGHDWDALKSRFIQCAHALDVEYNERKEHEQRSRIPASEGGTAAPASDA
jgi:hypothetical protein